MHLSVSVTSLAISFINFASIIGTNLSTLIIPLGKTAHKRQNITELIRRAVARGITARFATVDIVEINPKQYAHTGAVPKAEPADIIIEVTKYPSFLSPKYFWRMLIAMHKL